MGSDKTGYTTGTIAAYVGGHEMSDEQGREISIWLRELADRDYELYEKIIEEAHALNGSSAEEGKQWANSWFNKTDTGGEEKC